MCGIAGLVGIGDRELIERLTHQLCHRGPDAGATRSDRNVHLGHRRLAVLDHEGGGQPMESPDGRVTLVFNGEIYNHAELRTALEHRGHRFRSDHSDTEVVLNAYLEWGAGMCARFNGMFAIAVVDRVKDRLILARDRFGEKPLYYATTRDGLAFSSEVRTLLMVPGVDDEPDRRALTKLFAYGFIPAPLTSRRGVRKVEPGSIITSDLVGAGVTANRYWRFEKRTDIHAVSDGLLQGIREAVQVAVKRRMQSDVPLGVLLSGGMDSSAVATIAAAESAQGLRTFTLGFDEPSFDEREFARSVAASIGSVHHERVIRTTDLDSAARVALDHLDEPLGDASFIPMFHLCRLAREHATVVLTGDGADELFGGYDPFLALGPERVASLLPHPFVRGIRSVIGILPRSPNYMNAGFRLDRFLRGMLHPPQYRAAAWIGPADVGLIEAVSGCRLDAEDLYCEAIETWQNCSGDSADRMEEFFVRLYLPDNILMKSDSASMACSLEARSIFLDNDVVGLAERIPARLKFRRRRTKTLLRAAIGDLVPERIRERPKKGFGVPLQAWIDSTASGTIMEGATGDSSRHARWLDERAIWTSVVVDHFGLSSALHPERGR